MTVEINKYNSNLILEKDLEKYDFSNLGNYTDKYKNYMGWRNIKPSSELIDDINKTGEYIRNNCDIFLVIGIGGSYMGSLCIIESLNPYFYNNMKKPNIYFCGTSLSNEYIKDLKTILNDKDIIVNVISKSGETLEIKRAYEEVKRIMSKKYSASDMKKRIIVTTGRNNSLWEESIENEYKLYNIGDSVGGRFSVFTAAGLLPIAVSGLDIKQILKGAMDANSFSDDTIKYATARDVLEKKNKNIEAYTVYEPKLYYLSEWLKQLYSESLGKKGKGILPISVINTRDLHSLGQFIQEGKQLLFETNIIIKEENELNNKIIEAVGLSHSQNDVVVNNFILDKLDEYNIGYLLQFFMMSVVVSGYLNNINAFNQDGVEVYKKTLAELIK